MNSNNLVSIIIPCYNHGAFLGEALDSVLLQKHKNWECLIVNDGSTDNSADIGKKYCLKDPRVKLINKENGGLSSARNAGLKESKGAFISFLDADDKWESSKLKNQLKQVIEDSADVIFSDYNFFDEKKTFHHNELPVPESLEVEDFIARNPCRASSSSIMIKRRVFETVGFFDLNLRSLEDLDYWFRCFLQNFRFVFSIEKDVLIRMHGLSMQKNYIKMYVYHLILLEKQLNQIRERKLKVSERAIQLAINERLSKMRWYALQAKRNDLAISTHFSGMNFSGLSYLNINNSKAFLFDLFGLRKMQI